MTPGGAQLSHARPAPLGRASPRVGGRLPTLRLRHQHGTGKRRGLLCRSRRRREKRSREALLRGQIRLPFRWGQGGGVALSGEPAAGLLSPSGSSCVSSESMISQAPEQLDAGDSLLPP